MQFYKLIALELDLLHFNLVFLNTKKFFKYQKFKFLSSVHRSNTQTLF